MTAEKAEKRVARQSKIDREKAEIIDALSQIDTALKDGKKLNIFKHYTGQRVVRFEDEKGALIAFGEDNCTEWALVQAGLDLKYKKLFYQKKQFASDAEINTYLWQAGYSTDMEIDKWIFQEGKLDARKKEDKIRVELTRLKNFEIPQDFLLQAIQKGVTETPPGIDRIHGYMYRIMKSGEGQNFTEALTEALNAPELPLD